MKIQTVNEKDYKVIKELIVDVFTKTEYGYGGEAELVEKIRLLPDFLSELEVIAVTNCEIIGYGLLSRATIADVEGLVLAPLAIASAHQNSGVGTAILMELEKRAVEMGVPFISILGHPEYYQRFEYGEAKKYNIQCPFEVPSEAFMIKPLFADALENVEGILKYSEAFE